MSMSVEDAMEALAEDPAAQIELPVLLAELKAKGANKLEIAVTLYLVGRRVGHALGHLCAEATRQTDDLPIGQYL